MPELKPTPIIKLGQKVEDIVSGVKGIAVAKMIYLNGCVQYAVREKRRSKEGEPVDAIYVDAEQLKVVDEGILKKKVVTNTGGVKPAPKTMGLAKI